MITEIKKKQQQQNSKPIAVHTRFDCCNHATRVFRLRHGQAADEHIGKIRRYRPNTHKVIHTARGKEVAVYVEGLHFIIFENRKKHQLWK
jgi:hypothetical protein